MAAPGANKRKKAKVVPISPVLAPVAAAPGTGATPTLGPISTFPISTGSGGGVPFLPITPGGGIPGGPTGPPVPSGPSFCPPPIPAGICQAIANFGPNIVCNLAPSFAPLVGANCGGSNLPAPGGSGCPPGHVLDTTTGQCKVAGAGGVVQRTLPGGATGMLQGGTPVVGGFGRPGVTPAQVGTITDRMGMVKPILRCPTGFVLGKDEICYVKSTIPAGFRKWKPKKRPPISAKDWRAMQVSERVQKKVKEVASKAGFTTAKKGASRRRSAPRAPSGGHTH